MADRRLPTNMPIWVRVSGMIALVLVGVVVSSMLLGGSTSGSHEGGRDRGGQIQEMDRNEAQTGSAAPFESEAGENPAPPSYQTTPKESGPSDGSGGPRDHTRSDGRRDH